MKHVHYTDVDEKEVDEEGCKDVHIRWLITREDGAENFAMRMFKLGPYGHTPYHEHDWEHEVFILEGEGFLKTEDGEIRYRSGDVLFVPAMEKHQFVNDRDAPQRFLCLIPYKD